MLYLLFLILFNDSFGNDKENPPKALARPSLERRQLEKVQKDLQKRYQGEAGLERLRADAEEKAMEAISKFKEENKEKPGLRPLVKAADQLLKKDNDGNGVALKKLSDFQKEFDSQFQNYKKRIDKIRPGEKKATSEPVAFDYKLAQEEELREKNHRKGKNEAIKKEGRELIKMSSGTERVILWIAGCLLTFLAWLGWKKWR